MTAGLIHMEGKRIWSTIAILVCVSLVFVGDKANQSMTVAGTPKGMTYVEFIQDRRGFQATYPI